MKVLAKITLVSILAFTFTNQVVLAEAIQVKQNQKLNYKSLISQTNSLITFYKNSITQLKKDIEFNNKLNKAFNNEIAQKTTLGSDFIKKTLEI